MTGSDAVAFITIGDEVFAADGDNMGSVAEVQSRYFVVTGGDLFPSDAMIPISAITSATPGRITLAVSKEEALQRGWQSSPFDVQSTSDESYVARTGGDEIVIPLREEELFAATRPVAGGDVHITKRVVSVDRTRDLLESDDEIRVERRIVERSGPAGEPQAFEQIIIELPLPSDTGDGRRPTLATEEIIVTRETVQRIERVTGTVRREEIVIDGDDVSENEGQGESFRPA
ncbi:MAG: YsnF/AvaK domain-containing protein [Chloroflexia bacterium]|nr:YsnF/AvaK domain-containing protein [Chloroflexia bacterium]